MLNSLIASRLSFIRYLIKHPASFNRALRGLNVSPLGTTVHDTIDDVIKKCHACLRFLELNGSGPMTWSSQPASLDMPALEPLCFSFGTIDLALLQSWMERMPHLKRLGMVCSHLPESISFSRWSYIFDAIRDHPNVSGPNVPGLSVGLDHIVTCSWTEVSYSGVVRRQDGAKKPSNDGINEHVDAEDLEDVDGAFERHFYHGVPYCRNRVLTYYLDDNEDDDEDEEEDQGDDQNSEDDEDSENGEAGKAEEEHNVD